MIDRGLRRLSWALALAAIVFLGWRDLTGIGAALTGLNAEQLAGNDPSSYAKFLQIGVDLASTRHRDFALAIAPETQPLASTALGATLLHNLAHSTWQQGDKQAALDLQRQALQNDPDRAEFHFNLGLMLAATGDLAGAQSALREATLLAPDWAEAQVHLSAAALARGDLAIAEKAARRGLALGPDSLAAAHVLATALIEAKGDGQMSAAEIAELAMRFPHDQTLRLYQAIQLRKVGQRQASTDLLLNLLRVHPDEALTERLKAELALNAR
jgi:tetratricopeptide (TPR) repeat protein